MTSYFKFFAFGFLYGFILMINCFFGAYTIYGLYNFGFSSLFDEFLFPFLAFLFLLIAFYPLHDAFLNFHNLKLLSFDKIEVSRPPMIGKHGLLNLGHDEKYKYHLHEVLEISNSKYISSLITITFLKDGKRQTFKSFLKNGEFQKLKALCNKENG